MSVAWDRFVAAGARASSELEDGIAAIVRGELAGQELRARMEAHGHDCFALGYQALLLGAPEIGRLALACERACDLVIAGALPADGIPVLASAAGTLAAAFTQLASPDQSGARTEGLPLEAATYELETLFPGAGGAPAAPGAPDVVPASSLRRRDTPAPAPDAAEPDPETDAVAGGELGQVWVPSVDEDMVELFFEEAGERLEELSVKLLDIEQRPGDEELLRDVFRDLHTVKGSSAMVGLDAANKLAHAAEDLVGQLREGDREADGAVVDALLAALDGLREIIRQARDRVPITVDAVPIVKRLRDPSSAVAAPEAEEPEADPDADGTEPRVPSPAAARSRRPERQTIRVDFDKLDKLMNLVGELVLGRDGLKGAIQSLSSVSTELSSDRHLTRRLLGARRAVAGGSVAPGAAAGVRSTLGALGEELGRVERVLQDISGDLDHATGRLDSVSDDLRDQVMKLRMVPIGGIFRKHHRTVRDLANSLGKRARLSLSGEETELDKLLVEALDEPLMHLVRNAVDHGVEPPDVRAAAGKSPEGTIRLSAAHRGNQMVIQIADDGKGIDPDALRQRARDRGLLTPEELETFDDKQVLDVIFRPGFSTAEKVSEVSGRGVGMDVVRQTIITQLKGLIDIDSVQGQGSTFTLRLPLTLAIIQVLLARTGGEVFAIPLDTVVRTFLLRRERIHVVQDREVIAVEGVHVPLVRLNHVLELGADPYAADELQVVLVEIGEDRFGLACDHLLGKKEIVIKSLGDLLENVPCAAGATLLGDRCAIILDVPGIVDRALRRTAPPPVEPPRPTEAIEMPVPETAPHILLVEDSDIVRESIRRLLAAAGYRVTTAVDGVEGLEEARRHQYDLVSTDVMMPRMDGYELTRALRATAEYRNTPIVMVTSKGERIDRVRGFDAGVDEYITKPHDRSLLLRVVRQLLGDGGPP